MIYLLPNNIRKDRPYKGKYPERVNFVSYANGVLFVTLNEGLTYVSAGNDWRKYSPFDLPKVNERLSLSYRADAIRMSEAQYAQLKKGGSKLVKALVTGEVQPIQ